MLRLGILFILLLSLAGCASNGEPRWYDAALSDLRGDNQKMRGFSNPQFKD